MNRAKADRLRPPVYVHDLTVLTANLAGVAELLPKEAQVWSGLARRQPAVFARYTASADHRDYIMKRLGSMGFESMVVRRQYQDKVR